MDFLSVMGYSHVVNDVRSWSRDAWAMDMSDLKVLCRVRASLDIVICDTVLRCAPEVSERMARAMTRMVSANVAVRVFMATP